MEFFVSQIHFENMINENKRYCFLIIYLAKCSDTTISIEYSLTMSQACIQ